jgi:hypothetical protein
MDLWLLNNNDIQVWYIIFFFLETKKKETHLPYLYIFRAQK